MPLAGWQGPRKHLSTQQRYQSRQGWSPIRRQALGASVGLLLLCGLAAGFAAGQMEPELASATVLDLDLDRGFSGGPGRVRELRGETLAARCDECHVIDRDFSHPVDFVPDRRIPGHLPLVDGRMTCLTCHQAADGATHALAADRGQPLLRGTGPGPMFCTQCHAGVEDDRFTAHGTAVRRAHLRWPGDRRGDEAGNAGWAWEAPRGASARLAGTRSLRLDSESRGCLSCHDGSAAPGIGHSHSVGMKHDPMRYAGNASSRRLAWPDALDRRIRLFDGYVGCGSCHNPYGTESGLVVMPNDRGQLCISCHQGY